MNYGLYLSAAGALASMHRQAVLSNNLANLDTVGFKPDLVVTRQRLPERLENPEILADPQQMLERLGGGLLVAPTRVDLHQGPLVTTGRDLDLAIEGEGLFVIGGRGGPADLRYTRDGRFTLNQRGELVTAAGGRPVLDTGGAPIRLRAGAKVRVDDAGQITQDGAVAGQLRLVALPDTAVLTKAGGNLLRLTDGAAAPEGPFRGRLRQGFTEASAVDPIMTLDHLMNAAKAAQANLKLMQYHDQILGQAFNTFGRVA